jgi:hypothetical protein
MYHPRDRHAEDTAPATRGEAQLPAVTEQSDRNLAAWLTVSLADVLAEWGDAANESKLTAAPSRRDSGCTGRGEERAPPPAEQEADGQ